MGEVMRSWGGPNGPPPFADHWAASESKTECVSSNLRRWLTRAPKLRDAARSSPPFPPREPFKYTSAAEQWSEERADVALSWRRTGVRLICRYG